MLVAISTSIKTIVIIYLALHIHYFNVIFSITQQLGLTTAQMAKAQKI